MVRSIAGCVGVLLQGKTQLLRVVEAQAVLA
jgi:hypothetical protein